MDIGWKDMRTKDALRIVHTCTTRHVNCISFRPCCTTTMTNTDHVHFIASNSASLHVAYSLYVATILIFNARLHLSAFGSVPN